MGTLPRLRLTRTSRLIDQLQIVQRRLLDAGAASRRRHGTSGVGTAQRDGRDGQPWREMHARQARQASHRHTSFVGVFNFTRAAALRLP